MTRVSMAAPRLLLVVATSSLWSGCDSTQSSACEEDSSQPGNTVCGLNSEGVLMQDCVAGAWVDKTTCTSTSVCANGTSQNGNTVCGLNSEGVFVQDCVAGVWVDNTTCTGTDVCVNDSDRLGSTPCGPSGEGILAQDCTNGAWIDSATCVFYNGWGEGECRQGNGEYPLEFSIGYYDLTPHTAGTNASEATDRCQIECSEHRDWCLAVEVVTRDVWPTPVCSLITDRATFEGAGGILQNDQWGGLQLIDGLNFQTYCGGNGDCTHTNWAGGQLNPRAGYHCFARAY